MTETELAYFAGFLDGEGSVILGRHNGTNAHLYQSLESRMWMATSIANTQRGPLDELQKEFGGGIRMSGPSPERKHTIYCWQISGKKAAVFLRAVLPYLKLKRKQAEAALMFAETYGQAWKGKQNALTKEALHLRRIAFLAWREGANLGRGLSWSAA